MLQSEGGDRKTRCCLNRREKTIIWFSFHKVRITGLIGDEIFYSFCHKSAQFFSHCFHILVFERRLTREYLSFYSCIRLSAAAWTSWEEGKGFRLQTACWEYLRVGRCLCPVEILRGIWQRLRVCWLILVTLGALDLRSHANHSYTTGRVLRHCGPG